MGRPPKPRTTKKNADAPALVVPSLAKQSQVTAAALVVPSLAAEAKAEPAESREGPSKAKAAPKSRVLTKTQVLAQALARARTLERATATMHARAKRAKLQAKTRVPAHAKTQERQTRPTRGSVSKWGHWQSKKPDAKAMPPSYRPPKAPSLRPQPPPTPRQPDQEEVLWHVDLRGDGDQNNSDIDHDVLRHDFLTQGTKTAQFDLQSCL